MGLYTPEEVSNARRNIERYAWARAERDAAIETCASWMARSDGEIWDLIMGQSIPRGIHVNPDLGCPECGRDVYAFGNYPWKVSLDRPYKLECPSCGEVWPKNDFEKFHTSGLGSGGVFERRLADESLLYNAEHASPNDPLRSYAVDDGMGWIDESGNRWWFVAYYSHYCTWTELPAAALALGEAYLYTGDAAYAHKGAVILDRIADVYPDMDLTPYSDLGLYNSHGSTGMGRIKGCIWENGMAETLSLAYDMICEGMESDDELVQFLSAQAEKWQITQPKTSIAHIRENIERGLLREFIRSCRDRRIRGNEGMTQTAMATAAAVLDDPQETPEALDWLFEPGKSRGTGGGHIPATLIGEVDRDGVGNEAAPGYCFGWMNAFARCAWVLDRCSKYRDYDLYRDYPRLKRMYGAPYRLTALDRYTPHIGDTGNTGGEGMTSVDLETVISAFARFGDPDLARLAYKLNGNRADGLHTSIFEAEPEAIQKTVLDIVQQRGELELQSENLNGYGLTVFRHGEGHDQRAAYLYYGRNGGHGHKDRLNFGMYYRGMDVLPDLGYPEYADSKWPKRAGWTTNTISHNTVMINQQQQEVNWIGHCQYFAASHGVGVVEVASPEVYPGVQDYRRTLAMIDISAAESYLVDFFRVAGGNDHVLSFHAGEGDVSTRGIDLIPQEKGTYASETIPFGTHYDGPNDGRYRGSGFAYLYGVHRAEKPGAGWWADWKLVDTWKTQRGETPLHLRYRVLSNVEDAALSWGDPPQNKPGNPRRIRYVLLHNSGADRKSLFVSIIEPYREGQPYIADATRIDLGTEPDDLTAAAVKITTHTGRIDHILSSDDPNRVFDLSEGITAAGQFAIISRDNGQIAIFLVGGTQVSTPFGTLRINAPFFRGTVTDFHREETGPAWVEIEGDLPTDKRLIGTQLRILNDGIRDACYTISDISPIENNKVRVGVGDTSFIRGLVSREDYEKGFTYDISTGDPCEIQNAVHLHIANGEVETVCAAVDYEWEV